MVITWKIEEQAHNRERVRISVDGVHTVRTPIVPCSLTIPPSIKDLYAARCGRNMLQEASDALCNVSGVTDVVCQKRRVVFTVPGTKLNAESCYAFANRDCLAAIHAALKHLADKTWNPVCELRTTLVHVVIKKLQQDVNYRVAAASHYAAKHGACQALHILQLSDTWV